MDRSTTLFRYAQVSRPDVYDLASRADEDPQFAAALQEGDEALGSWAAQMAEALGPDALDDIAARYRPLFSCDPLCGLRPPSGADLAADKAGETRAQPDTEAYRADLLTSFRAAAAYKILGDTDAAQTAARWRQVLEALPSLAEGRQPPPFAPATLRRFVPLARRAATETREVVPMEPPDQPDPTRPRAADDVAYLWRVHNRLLVAERDAIESAARGGDLLPPPDATGDAGRRDAARTGPDTAKFAAPAATAAAAAARRAEQLQRVRLRRAQAEMLARERRAMREREEQASLSTLLSMNVAAAAEASGATQQEIREAIERLKDNAALKEKLAGKDRLAFCRIYDAVTAAEEAPGSTGRSGANGVIQDGVETVNTALAGPLSQVLTESPLPQFGDDVRLLGTARLIRVEERFLKYSEGEIARVENILAGEHRVSERKSLREYEVSDERMVEETTSASTETSATTTSDLASEVANELSSRFSTDVSASASGGGGGSVGVVNFEGEGAFEAASSLGVDVSSRSETRSELGREIVEASVEKVSKTTRTRRATRTRTLNETLERLEIDNGGAGADHRRGIYTFLDKHVCVTETPYGIRWFAKAVLVRPGRDLLARELARISIGQQGVERPPEFTLSPADITPANYLHLAGRYRAQGLTPPPPPSQRVARVYKADETNGTDSDPKGLEAVGKALMPVMKPYRRHLVTDVIPIPEGYEVQEVRLAVCHGANGMSVPVDLPLKLVSAGIMTAPVALSYAPLMLPAALWNVLLLASPIVHHNTDSSALTATVGVQSRESSYYFFDADMLVRELMTLFSGLDALGPQVMSRIQQMATEVTAALAGNAAAMAGALNTALASVTAAVAAVFDAIRTQLESASAFENLNPQNIADAIITALTDFGTATSTALAEIPDDLFDPLNGFVQEVTEMISEAAEGALTELLEGLSVGIENNRTLIFGDAAGTLGELPVSLNIACLKPGLTANLSACLIRTGRALDQWRLETYAALHQSWLQMVADYEGKRFLGKPADGPSPGTMRREEHVAIKDLVFRALNTLHGAVDPANGYSFDRMALFEHGIDWANMSYRVYDYGPNREKLALEHLGAYRGADATRRSFLTATWAQVMLPFSPNPELERAMLAWFQEGAPQIGGALTDDELATLWADVVAARANLEEPTGEAVSRIVVLPTDHVVLRTEEGLPENDATPCAVPDGEA